MNGWNNSHQAKIDIEVSVAVNKAFKLVKVKKHTKAEGYEYSREARSVMLTGLVSAEEDVTILDVPTSDRVMENLPLFIVKL